MVFLVAQGLPFKVLIGCDMLRRHSAIIDLASGKVTLRSDGYEWSAEIIGSTSAPQYRRSYHVRENVRTPIGNKEIITESELWQKKLQEIMSFQGRGHNQCGTKEKVSGHLQQLPQRILQLIWKSEEFCMRIKIPGLHKFQQGVVSYRTVLKGSCKERNTKNDRRNYYRKM